MTALTGRTEEASDCTLRRALHHLRWASRRCDISKHHNVLPCVPQTSRERLDASLNETRLPLKAAEEKGKTVLYLAYGSNLCNETFRDVRGIRPLSQINVLVPELGLTFDLPGVPYTEPCFANSARREPLRAGAQKGGYHKDRWHKGMVGCVYEVTPADYAHIIATEGGGASYRDVLVTCYPLSNADTVPESPTTEPFKAHTLFAPIVDEIGLHRTRDRFARPDSSYAQPSARYLKLITDGASELSLPAEYQQYLQQIRPYTVTTKRQAMGKALFTAIWMPFILFLFALQKQFQDEKGRSPKWLVTMSGLLFMSMWNSYDAVWKPAFGDGERTEGQGQDMDYGQAEPAHSEA